MIIRYAQRIARSALIFGGALTLWGCRGASAPVSSTGSNPAGGSSGTDVTTYHNDVARTGQNTTETILTQANVNSQNFGLLRNMTVDGKVDAEPLYLSQLTVAGKAYNVVFVATENVNFRVHCRTEFGVSLPTSTTRCIIVTRAAP